MSTIQRLMSSTGSFVLAALLGSVGLTGCAGLELDEPDESDGTEVVEKRVYLPHGVPVPVDVVPSADPEPYNEELHGPAFNPVPELNLAARPGPRDLPIPPPGNGDRGFFINGNAGTGIYAKNDVQDNLLIPNSDIGTTIYAPTHMSPGGACIETVRASWRYAGAATTSYGHGFWDWCRAVPGWGTFETIDLAWKNKYARSDGTEQMYFTHVYKTPNGCWAGLLWNYNTGVWDQKLLSCGVTKSGFGNTGWTMWESWDASTCPAYPRIKSNTIQTLINGVWQNLTAAQTTQLGPSKCFSTGAYTFSVLVPNSAWEARTP